MDVDIEINLGDAFLLRLVRAARMPPAASCTGMAHISQFETTPLRQLPAAFTGELPGQHDLFAVLVGSDDVRTQFATPAIIGAEHLLLAEDGVAKERVGGARHDAHPARAGVRMASRRQSSGDLWLFRAAKISAILTHQETRMVQHHRIKAHYVRPVNENYDRPQSNAWPPMHPRNAHHCCGYSGSAIGWPIARDDPER